MTITTEAMQAMFNSMTQSLGTDFNLRFDSMTLNLNNFKEEMKASHLSLNAKIAELQTTTFTIGNRQEFFEAELTDLRQSLVRIKKELQEAMEARIEEVKFETKKGNKIGGLMRNNILWCRGWRKNTNGKPINLRNLNAPDIPSAFYDMCSSISQRGKGDFTLNLMPGVSY